MSIETEIQRIQTAKEDIKSAIIEKGGTVEDNALIDTYGEAIRGIEVGGSSGEDYLQYATNLTRVFHSAIFPTGTEVVINAPNLKETMQQFMYYSKGATKIVLKGNVNNVSLHMERAFGGTDLEVIDFTGFSGGVVKPRYMTGMFSSSTKLHTILGVLDLSNVLNASQQNAPFDACSNLQEIRFAQNSILYSLSFAHCKSLSDASINSIIDGLADLTGQTAQTITFGSTVKGKLTEEQIASITAKNWTLA